MAQIAWNSLPRVDVADPTPCSPSPPGTGTDAQLFWKLATTTGMATVTATQSTGTNPLGFYVVE